MFREFCDRGGEAHALNNLGNAVRRLGEAEEAPGGETGLQAEVLNDLGESLADQGRVAEAPA